MAYPEFAKYTIAWILDSRKLLSFATNVLDEVHDGVRFNNYTFGRIGTRNVLIAYHDDDVITGIQAINFQTHIHQWFPNVTNVYLVGVGEGIPGKLERGDIALILPSDHNKMIFDIAVPESIRQPAWDRTKLIQGDLAQRSDYKVHMNPADKRAMRSPRALRHFPADSSRDYIVNANLCDTGVAIPVIRAIHRVGGLDENEHVGKFAFLALTVSFAKALLLVMDQLESRTPCAELPIEPPSKRPRLFYARDRDSDSESEDEDSESEDEAKDEKDKERDEKDKERDEEDKERDEEDKDRDEDDDDEDSDDDDGDDGDGGDGGNFEPKADELDDKGHASTGDDEWVDVARLLDAEEGIDTTNNSHR